MHVFNQDIGMELGFKKCVILILRKRKADKSDGIDFLSGKVTKEIEKEGYSYLGIPKLDWEFFKRLFGKCKQTKFSADLLILTKKIFNGKLFLCNVSKQFVQRCSVKQVFLEISQNSQENTCARLFFNKIACLRPRWFPVNFVKFTRTPFYIEHFSTTASECDGKC